MATAPETLVIEYFRQAFGYEPALLACAPGRVNLIGEHTDYNDGFVLPIAIDRAVYIAAAPRDDAFVRLHSLDFQDEVGFSLAENQLDQQHSWSNYPRSIAWVLQGHGHKIGGMDAVIHGNVPLGAGLSSSAAIEVATATAFQSLFNLDIPGPQVALLAQEAENHFVGMNCGIMDQFISALGQADHALLIDCRSLDYQAVPIPQGCSVVVANTMKRRGLVDTEYNNRRAECEEGVRRLQMHLPGVRALRDVSESDLARFAAELPPIVLRRCHHVVSENARALAAVSALSQGDASAFGQMMYASHASLRDDYQVSCPELDRMVEIAQNEAGIYGARMTGAGFGGCTVNLVQMEKAEAVAAALATQYEKSFAVCPDVYICSAEAGAKAKKLR